MVIIIINFLPFIENIALLAETALRFLELVQLKNLNVENDPNSEEIDEVTHPSGNWHRWCGLLFQALCYLEWIAVI